MLLGSWTTVTAVAMIMTVIALVGSMVLYNFWPKWMLYRIGLSLEVANKDLIESPIAERHVAVISALRAHFISACHRSHVIVHHVIPEMEDRIPLNARIAELTHESYKAVTREGVDELLALIRKLEHPAVVAEREDEYRAMEKRVRLIHCAFHRLERIRPRL